MLSHSRPALGRSRQTPLASQTRTVVLSSVLLMCLLSAALPGAHATSADAAPEPSFRCQRPFSSMNSFVDVAKAEATDNCNFRYFTVIAANAELQCVTTAALPASGQAEALVAALDKNTVSCNVTLEWSMRRAGNVAALLQQQVGTDKDYYTKEAQAGQKRAAHNQGPPGKASSSATPFITEDADIWRYAVSLRAKGDSTVNYKGFDGDGYSLCCDALREAECTWMNAEQGDNDLAADEELNADFALQRSRLLRSCPLPFPATLAGEGEEEGADADEAAGAFGASANSLVRLSPLDEDDIEEGLEEGVFHGRITKPLHRPKEGWWDVTVEIWRRRQQRWVSPEDLALEADKLGRIVAPFTLDFADLHRRGRITHITSTALVAEEVKEVVEAAAAPTTDDSANGESGDL